MCNTKPRLKSLCRLQIKLHPDSHQSPNILADYSIKHISDEKAARRPSTVLLINPLCRSLTRRSTRRSIRRSIRRSTHRLHRNRLTTTRRGSLTRHPTLRRLLNGRMYNLHITSTILNCNRDVASTAPPRRSEVVICALAENTGCVV
jgi:hypothetical protein